MSQAAERFVVFDHEGRQLTHVDKRDRHCTAIGVVFGKCMTAIQLGTDMYEKSAFPYMSARGVPFSPLSL